MSAESGPPKLRLTLLFVGSFIFFLTLLLSGNVSGCIALQACSYHVLSDALSPFIGLLSVLVHQNPSSCSQLSITNTYGWVRIGPVGSLIGHVFTVSLCFGSVVRSLRYLFVPDDGLHRHCRTMLAMGGLGVVVHSAVIVYAVLVRWCTKRSDNASSPTFVEKRSFLQYDSRSTKTKRSSDLCPSGSHQENHLSMLLNMTIGLLASVLIILDALVHFLIDHDHFWIHYVDPCLALVISVIIIASTIPTMTQNALTLIQTIPQNIDVNVLRNELRNAIPEIAHIHDFHVWRLEGERIIATFHVVFGDGNVDNDEHFSKISKRIAEFCYGKRIVSVTFQPEFAASSRSLGVASPPRSSDAETVLLSASDCLYECSSLDCAKYTCCGANAERRLASQVTFGSVDASSQLGGVTIEASSLRRSWSCALPKANISENGEVLEVFINQVDGRYNADERISSS